MEDECSECKGKGNFLLSSLSRSGHPRIVICDLCKGSGRREVEVEDS